jgi:hypothetical protein
MVFTNERKDNVQGKFHVRWDDEAEVHELEAGCRILEEAQNDFDVGAINGVTSIHVLPRTKAKPYGDAKGSRDGGRSSSCSPHGARGKAGSHMQDASVRLSKGLALFVEDMSLVNQHPTN